MPVGLKLPLGVDSLGRAERHGGTDQLRKLLVIALSPCPSSNPFQNLGLPENIIFSINSPNAKAQIDLAIRNIFERFETQGRAKLRSVDFATPTDEGQLPVIINYQDLETTKDEDISLTLPQTGNVRPRVSVLE
jgi:hypothetical protein